MKISKMSLFVCIIALFAFQLYPLFIANESEKGFGSVSGPGVSGSQGNALLRQYIVEGGGYYLNSYSQMLLFLHKVEMSEMGGFNAQEAQEILNTAVDSLEKAKMAYMNLKNLAAITPYNPQVIDRLAAFDYTAMQTFHGMMPHIFKKVEKLLVKGDIRGIYDRLYKEMDGILGQLKNLKTGLDKGNFPKIAKLWRINQHYVETSLFGQYAAEVFYKI